MEILKYKYLDSPPLHTVYEVVVVTDCVYEAVVAVLLSVQHTVLDEDWDGSQDEGHKQVHVNEVPGAVELPGEERERKYIKYYIVFTQLINAAGFYWCSCV